MKTSEIRNKVIRLAKSFDADGCTVNVRGNSHLLTIEIDQMYGYVNVNFAFLKEISELLKTDKIDDERHSRGGCETCDYGSSYEVILTCKDCGVEIDNV